MTGKEALDTIREVMGLPIDEASFSPLGDGPPGTPWVVITFKTTPKLKMLLGVELEDPQSDGVRNVELVLSLEGPHGQIARRNFWNTKWFAHGLRAVLANVFKPLADEYLATHKLLAQIEEEGNK